MAKDLFEFQWDVPTDGYQWVPVGHVGGANYYEIVAPDQAELQALVPTSGELPEMRRYMPLAEETGLFRILADLELNPESVRAFASRYGRLGNCQLTVLDPKRSIARHSDRLVAETWPHWVQAIRELRFTVHLWELARTNDRTRLARYVRWENDDVVYCFSDPQWIGQPVWYAPPAGEYYWRLSRSSERVFLNIPPGDLVMPARYGVQCAINQHLNEIGAQLLWNRNCTRQEVCFLAPHLTAAVWLQFAQAVDGDKGYRSCQECGRWFELSPKTGRADKRYCSNACRSSASRGRQVRAREMFQAGKSVAEITQLLKSSETIVRRWVTA